jgi:hypothetical protein
MNDGYPSKDRDPMQEADPMDKTASAAYFPETPPNVH